MRPWLSIGKIPILDVTNPPETIKIPVKNTGHSPALKVMVEATSGYDANRAPFPDDPPFTAFDEFAAARRSRVSIGAGEFKDIETPVVRLDAERIAALAELRSALYVYGRITYEDSFGESYWTTFASVYDPKGWTSCNAHNDET